MKKTTKATTKVKIVEIGLRRDRPIDENPFEDITIERLKTFKGIKDSQAHVGAAHALYVRQLLHAGRIEGVKVQYKGYQKWLIDPESIDYYHAHKATRSGLRRYLLRAKATDETAIRDALTAIGIEFTLEFNYKKGKTSTD